MGLVSGGINVNYSGILNKLNSIPKNLDTVVAKIATGVTNECVSNSPVDTGYLRSQWNIQNISKALWRISNNTSYIVSLEFGTKRFQGHVGFVRGSIERWRSEGIKMIKAAVK